MNHRPIRLVADARGRLLLLSALRLPPSVFDTTGRLLGLLGRRGRGPGETVAPSWIDTSLDDTIRVYEPGRVVLFSPDLKHVRTITDRRPDRPRFLAALRPGVHAWITSRITDFHRPSPQPILVRTDSGDVLGTIPRPLIRGELPKSVFTRNLNRARSLWLVDAQERTLEGYEITALSENGVRGVTYLRKPEWWTNGHVNLDNPTLPVTWLVDARQVNSEMLLVLFSTPRSDWARFAANPKTQEGYWSRFETALEIVSTRTGQLLGAARVPGYAISIVSSNAIASFTEDEDGFPRVSVFRYTLVPR